MNKKIKQEGNLEKQKRLQQALRDNLRRRKQQQRGRKTDDNSKDKN